MARQRQLVRGRSVDRLINFSDAIVAVAVTVLVLPLVDILPTGGESVWQVIADNGSQLWTFIFTFFVAVIMWLAHSRILNEIEAYDSTLVWLNTLWLIAIVLLPWTSAMYGETGGGQDATGVVYWLSLAVLSGVGGLMAAHIRKHPDLEGDGAAAHSMNVVTQHRGDIFAICFIVIAVVSLVWPSVAWWLPFAIIPISIWLRRAGASADDSD